MPQGTDLSVIGVPVKGAFEAFAKETGRKVRARAPPHAHVSGLSMRRPFVTQLHLMIEPGTFLLANSCSLVTTVQDTAQTPTRSFLKLDAGMTEVLRPSLCVCRSAGAQSVRR